MRRRSPVAQAAAAEWETWTSNVRSTQRTNATKLLNGGSVLWPVLRSRIRALAFAEPVHELVVELAIEPRMKEPEMLELRPGCEHCDADLPASSNRAYICSFECTFCAQCAMNLLGLVCPNCLGDLAPRPNRSETLLASSPPSRVRVHKPVDLDRHAQLRAERPIDNESAGPTLLRYVRAWQSGDLAALIGCYDESFTLNYFGASEFAGRHVGIGASLAILAEVSTRAPRTLLSVDEVLVGPEGGQFMFTERLERDGESAELKRVLRFHISGGFLRECWLYEESQALVDHFWRPEFEA